MNWNLTAEVLGFLSGCALLWPAVVQNATLRNAAVTTGRFLASRSKLGKVMATTPTARQPATAPWSPRDQWLLTAGAVLLFASFGVKLALLLKWLS